MDRLLYCRGLTVDIEDNAGCTPLWLAACFGSVDCVDVLLVHMEQMLTIGGGAFSILQSVK